MDIIDCGLRHELPVRQMAMNVYVLILISVKVFFWLCVCFVFLTQL